MKMRVCAEGALQTNYTVGDVEISYARGVAVYEKNDAKLYCVLRDGSVYVTRDNFGGSVVGIIPEIISIGQYDDGVFLLDTRERLKILEVDDKMSISTSTVASGVGYADGSADFTFYVRRNGSVSCASKLDICPPVERLTGLVHKVSSANIEGITL